MVIVSTPTANNELIYSLVARKTTLHELSVHLLVSLKDEAMWCNGKKKINYGAEIPTSVLLTSHFIRKLY